RKMRFIVVDEITNLIHHSTNGGHLCSSYLASHSSKTCNDSCEFGRLDWFGHVHLKSSRQGANPIDRTAVGRQRDRRGTPSLLGRKLANPANQIISVYFRHADIGYQNIRTILLI